MQQQRLQEEAYWKSRWESNKTGWHLTAPNSVLVEFFDQVAPAPAKDLSGSKRTAFVPLCGKSLDVNWLKDQGYSVVACEISEKAVSELFQEMAVTPRSYTEYQPLTGKTVAVAEHGSVKIYVANFFDLGYLDIDAVFDRAALVALPANTREQYTKHMLEITNRAPQLLIAFEHARNAGPPHSVPLELVQKYYGAVYAVEPVMRRMTDSGIIEAAYVLLTK